MQAAFVKAPGRVKIKQVPVPSCGEGDVLVRVEYCGLCGSDILDAKAWAKEWKRFGHEIVGTVAATGQRASGCEVGHRVVIALSAPCGRCPACQAGKTRLCKGMLIAEQGGFGQYVMVDQELVHRVPDEVPAEIACLAEPITVILDGLEAASAQAGDCLFIIGGGTIANLAQLVGSATGMNVVGLMSRSLSETTSKCLSATGGEYFKWRMVGRKTIGAPGALRGKLASLSGRLVVLHTAPACHIRKYVDVLPYNSSIVNLGLSAKPKENELKIDAKQAIMNRLQILSAFPVPCTHFPRAMELLAGHVGLFSTIETEAVPLTDLPEVLAGRKKADKKVLVVP